MGDSKKIIGYVISILGIAVMALGFGMVPGVQLDSVNDSVSGVGIIPGSNLLKNVNTPIISGVGIALIIVGILISLSGKKKRDKDSRHEYDEVPIYEGAGKHRKIVGYRRK